MIELYYVRGINRFDTPLFTNLSSQEDWFWEHRVKTILDESFYPPYYQNTINISDEDADFTTAINYLSLEYLGKKYYYFIDRVSYITDGLITLHITLDTIQTYMFNIDFISSQVSRRSINRWNGNEINREYIRENVSEGQFINKETRTINSQTSNYKLAIIETTAEFNNYKTILSYNYDFYNIRDGKNLLVLPLEYGLGDEFYDGIDVRLITGEPIQQVGINTLAQLQKYIESPYVTRIFIINADVLGVTVQDYYDEDNDFDYKVFNFEHLGINGIKLVGPDDIISENTGFGYCLLLNNVSNLPIINHIYNIPFNKNTNKTTPFSKSYIPQLLDNNYMQIFFGEKKDFTTYPLEKITTTTLNFEATTNLFTNTRFYRMYTDIFDKSNDVYNTTISVSTPRDLTLVNDPWKDFQANNYGFERLYQAQIDQANANTLRSTLIAGLITGPNKSVSQGISGGMSGGGKAAAIVGVVNGIVSTAGSITDDVISNEITKDYITEKYTATKENHEYAPQTIRKTNNGIDSLMYYDMRVVYTIDEVSDILDVAQILEGYGYAVHENYGSENLFYALNTRYYYNIVKCDKVEIALSGVINDNETIMKIKDRFYNGLRLWNTGDEEQEEYMFTPYVYDNVEIENL